MGCASILPGLNPGVDRAWWRQLAFDLAYTMHGGSGLGFGWGDLLDMEIQDALALRELLVDQRRREAEAMKKANGRAAGK